MQRIDDDSMSLAPPDMTALLGRHLTDDERRELVNSFRLYQRTFSVVRGARLAFLLSLVILGMSYIPVVPSPDLLRPGSGLAAASSFLLMVLVRPSFEKAIETLQELSDRALIRAQMWPVDLMTGKPKR